MATVTIRNLPDETVRRIKESAARNGRSMEEELRNFVKSGYVSRAELLQKIAETRSHQTRSVSPEEIEAWIDEGRE